MRHLNGRELVNENWGSAFILFHIFIFKLDNAPDTAAEKPIILSWVILRDRNCFDSEIGKLRLIAVRLNVEINRDLVNHGIAASLTEDRKDLLRLVGTDVVFSQNPLDVCNAGFNDILVIGTAILSKKKLKDINGNICPFLDFLCEVFADNPAVEYLAQFVVDYSVCILC